MDNSLPDGDFAFPVCRACLTRGPLDPYTVIACGRRNDVTTSSAGRRSRRCCDRAWRALLEPARLRGVSRRPTAGRRSSWRGSMSARRRARHHDAAPERHRCPRARSSSSALEPQVVMLTPLEHGSACDDAVQGRGAGFVLKDPGGRGTSPRAIQAGSRAAVSTVGRASSRPCGCLPRRRGEDREPADLRERQVAQLVAEGQVDQAGRRACSRSPQNRRVSPAARHEEVERPRTVRRPAVRYAIREGLITPCTRVFSRLHL